MKIKQKISFAGIVVYASICFLLSCKQHNENKNEMNNKPHPIPVQTEYFEDSFKNKFAGNWLKKTEYQTNTIKILFEPGKNYATVIDIGSGEAPPLKLQAFRKETMLYISPTENGEYCELKVKNNQLIFIIPAKGKQEEVKTVFDRVESDD